MVNVDVDDKLAAIRRAVDEARSVPMSASVMVNGSELLGLVDELEAAVAEAHTESGRVVTERDGIVDDGRREADEIIRQAHIERDRLVSDTEVFRLAKRQADNLVVEAQTEATELRKEVDDYVDGMLANFEITLERTMEAVKRGRDRLAGRSALDSLTEDDVDRIKLPEHLEG